jgi:hypothetical protein
MSKGQTQQQDANAAIIPARLIAKTSMFCFVMNHVVLVQTHDASAPIMPARR